MELRVGYKNTEVGIIPEDWEVKKLGDILRVIGGGAFKSIDSTQNGVKWLKIANVGINQAVWDDESYLPKELIKDNENFLLQENDYVLALTRPILDRKLKITKLNENDVPALLNQRVGKIVVENQTDIDFAYYLFQRFETINGLLQSMAGTDPPNLSNKGIYGIDCAIPPTKAEQTAIATALSDVDALISSLEKLITKKRNIKQGAVQKLLQPKEVWDVKMLGNVIEFQGGSQPSLNTFIYIHKEGYIRLLQIRDYKTNKYETYIPFNLTRRFCNAEDIMIGRYGPPVFQILRGLEGAYNVALMKAIPTNEITKEFAYHFLKQDKLFNFVEKLSQRSSGQTGVDLQELRAYPINLPPIRIQKEIATILSDMDNEITALETKLEKYRKVKMGIMQNLLTGKIRLV